ncbi:methionyl-tRNA synthetase (MetRS) [Leptomonas seymouri]|uniref:methionine--tRNA ligase n=1 Tax=Leptomonas seymouri TaxID=5684 RepID=A0A0N1I0T9_LEPSE|nr:methionyl-tRNA synthetase (MetRS) [Leptomonas seymouri]|eukprot:KPI82714.1 methionyl-tRNA synthetase (MetRS) [Leptomonas seymouri]
MLKFFTEKANHQALKAVLCAIFVQKPLEVTLGSTYTIPYLQLPSSKAVLYSCNESARFVWSKYAAVPPTEEVLASEGEWLDWESTTLTPALMPLYTQRCITAEAEAALKKLDDTLKQHQGVIAVNGAPESKSFLVDSVLFAALLPALCEGGLLPAAQADAVPHLVRWFQAFRADNEELIASAFDVLSVQESGDFLRVARTYEVSPKKDKTFFATTPIYYVNASPHIGHVYSSLIVDVLGRYHRVKGEAAFTMTGTDEHGQKVAEAASKTGVSPMEFTTSVSNEFKTCFEQMNYNFNYFIRTTNPTHESLVQRMWKKLEAKGDIYLGKYEGWYSVSDESFLTAQNVTDGVDKDGNPCKISLESGHVVTWVEEENYMFRLSAFRERLLKYFHDNPNCIVPEFRRREVIKQVEKGLFDLSISRKRESVLNWSIPVPGDDRHCIYVWLDALFNYYTGALTRIAADGTEALDDDFHALNRWPCDAHVVGKDILKFHAIYWPAFLMSADLPLPERLVAHGWWTKDHKKISKSLGNAFDPVEKAKEFGTDALKYFLLRESNFQDDGDYNDKNMVARLNSELADTLGNLVSRCVAPKINVNGVWPEPAEYNEGDKKLITALNNLAGTADHYYCLPDIQKALIAIFEVLRSLNAYVTENAPWKLVKSDTARLSTVLYATMEGLRICVLFLQPVMPEKMAEIMDALGVPAELRRDVSSFHYGAMKPGTKIGGLPEGRVIFQKVALPAEEERPAASQDGNKRKK